MFCFVFVGSELLNKDKTKDRERGEREEKKKHKVMNDMKRENGEVKQPVKGRSRFHFASNL